jgi:hypothetical protein
MACIVTASNIKEALAALGLAGETGDNARYDPYFGPIITVAPHVIPFLTRIDDHLYQCREKSEIVMHDGGEPVWISDWEKCGIRNARNPFRLMPVKTGQGYSYHRRLFTISEATYIITERFDTIDRVFFCTGHPDFEWNYVLESLHEYRRLNKVHTPPKDRKRIQLK